MSNKILEESTNPVRKILPFWEKSQNPTEGPWTISIDINILVVL